MRDYSELELIAQAAVGFTDVSLAPDVVLELLAENKALRKNSDRYQWLRDKSQATNQFYLSVPLWFTGVRFRAQDVDEAIDAMSKGEQS